MVSVDVAQLLLRREDGLELYFHDVDFNAEMEVFGDPDAETVTFPIRLADRSWRISPEELLGS